MKQYCEHNKGHRLYSVLGEVCPCADDLFDKIAALSSDEYALKRTSFMKSVRTMSPKRAAQTLAQGNLAAETANSDNVKDDNIPRK